MISKRMPLEINIFNNIKLNFFLENPIICKIILFQYIIIKMDKKPKTDKAEQKESTKTKANIELKNKQMMSQSKIILYNFQCLKLILPFFSLHQLLSLSTISKQFQYNLSQYFRKFLLPEPYATHSSTIPQIYSSVKLVYNRKVFLYSVDNNKKHREQILVPAVCKVVQISLYVTKFETLDGSTYILHNEDYINKAGISKLTKQMWNDPAIIYKIPNDITQTKCVGHYVYFVRDCQILRYSVGKNRRIQEKWNQQVIDFEAPIDYFITTPSSASAIVVTNISSPKDVHYFLVTNAHNEEEEGQNINENQNEKPIVKRLQFPFQIQNPKNDIVIDYGTRGFILDSEGKVYDIDFAKYDQKHIIKDKSKQKNIEGDKSQSFRQNKLLLGKNISKIICSNKSYFAYENKNKNIKYWTNEEVLKWAENNGFDDYLKILKVSKVTGQKLLKMNKSYLEDVLGVTNVLAQQKMNVLIKQASQNKQKFQNYNVYAWGKNDKGQLCFPPSSFVKNLQKVKLPEDTQIFDLVGDHVLLYNTKTKQMMTNIVTEQKEIKEKQKKFGWQPITSSKIWSLTGHGNWLLIVESPGKKRVPQSMSEQPISTKKQKFRTAKNIMDQLEWDPKYNSHIQQFTIGFTNRTEGVLECTVEEFKKSEVKEICVMYFKWGGKIVWDKKNRIDIL